MPVLPLSHHIVTTMQTATSHIRGMRRRAVAAFVVASLGFSFRTATALPAAPREPLQTIERLDVDAGEQLASP